MTENLSVRPPHPRPPHPWVAAGRECIRFGVLLFDTRADWPAYFEQMQRAEELGFDSLWVPDHPLQCADAWVTLSALAVKTRTARLGTLVTCNQYRNPALVARMAADVDRMSGGRLVLGLGIGDDEDEARSMGVPFPAAPERQRALEESVRIIRGMWSGQPFTLLGDHVSVDEATLIPAASGSHIPLLIGGGGERVTLRQVAQYADVANFASHPWAGSAFTLDDVVRKYQALRGHCEALDRPYDSILRSHVTLPLVLGQSANAVQAKLDAIAPPFMEFIRPSLVAGTAREVIDHYRSLAGAGVQYFIPTVLESDTESLELLAREVVPAVAESGPRQR